MKKFWRSGMIDKKVVVERERKEHINKLELTIHFLKRELNSEYGMKECSKYGNMSAKEWKEARTKLIADDYDEVRVGDNVILDFGGECIIAAPKERLKDSMFNTYCEWLKNRGPYDSDLKFEKQTFGENKDENNTRTLRQEE